VRPCPACCCCCCCCCCCSMRLHAPPCASLASLVSLAAAPWLQPLGWARRPPWPSPGAGKRPLRPKPRLCQLSPSAAASAATAGAARRATPLWRLRLCHGRAAAGDQDHQLCVLDAPGRRVQAVRRRGGLAAGAGRRAGGQWGVRVRRAPARVQVRGCTLSARSALLMDQALPTCLRVPRLLPGCRPTIDGPAGVGQLAPAQVAAGRACLQR
jgi:hypothetical protein